MLLLILIVLAVIIAIFLPGRETEQTIDSRTLTTQEKIIECAEESTDLVRLIEALNGRTSVCGEMENDILGSQCAAMFQDFECNMGDEDEQICIALRDRKVEMCSDDAMCVGVLQGDCSRTLQPEICEAISRRDVVGVTEAANKDCERVLV